MQSSNIIELGIKNNLIKFDEEQKVITYLHQNKARNYQNPEEKVQAQTFLKLILEYKYPVAMTIQNFEDMGINTSLNIPLFQINQNLNKTLETVGPYNVVSFSAFLSKSLYQIKHFNKSLILAFKVTVSPDSILVFLPPSISV